MIYADQRWIGDHGIGRFARNVLAGLDYVPIPLTSHPAAAFDSLLLAQALRRLSGDDLFFSPGYNTPLACRARFVFSIHDLSHIHCSENSSPFIRLYYATVMKRACGRAARILTVSDFTRQEILEWCGLNSERVVNVGCGVDEKYKPGETSYGLPFPYVLCVSNRKRHKNEFRLIEAFARARIEPEVHLVLTGEPDRELENQIEANRLSSRVDFVGLVPDSKLPALYGGAEAMVFPSLYEGFGLPILEAMACGTPVVTSNVTAMPEVAGGAALLVSPTSVEQITMGIERILSDTSLRRELKGKGLLRAKEFSWKTTATKVRELLAACA